MARILVIDDQSLVREAIIVALEGAGHDVSEADNGDQGIALQKERPFDIIITDILMPVKEGIETIIQLKDEFKSLKIIAISGGGRGKDIDYLKLAKSLGANKALSKPFTNEELLLAVDECLR